ncbi:hypothetical protein H4S08_003448, partial [Coemansia sp. RSA 1365]
MPTITKVDLQGVMRDPISEALHGALVNQYAENLEQLVSKSTIALYQAQPFKKLKHVFIDFGSAQKCQFPYMLSEQIESLRLFNGLGDSYWTAFVSPEDDCDKIIFSNLKVINIAYSPRATVMLTNDSILHGGNGRTPKKLHFPALEHLYVSSMTQSCPLLEYSVLPLSLKSILIYGTAAVLRSIEHLQLPPAKHLLISLGFGSNSDTSIFTVINNLFANTGACEKVELHLNDMMLPITKDAIACPNITHLRISVQIRENVVLSLISTLHRLTKLELHQ